jgi:molecular chaperone DnaJ
MIKTIDHYKVLEVSHRATGAEIKSAYRRLAKILHPDRNASAADEKASHEAIVRLNSAYEVLNDPLARRSYDQQMSYVPTGRVASPQEREAAVQTQHERVRKRAETSTDGQIKDWIKKVYTPGIRIINQIIKPLKGQITDLSADPFDDELMGTFMDYLEECRSSLEKVQKLFNSVPFPPSMGGIASHVYYCLNQLGDALDELHYFTQNYDETALHTGYEMFRIANGLKNDAQDAVKELPK